jgi:hypothetical protein
MSGVRYPRLTRSTSFSYYAKVLEADPEFVQNANNVVEYEMSNGKVFKGFFKARGPYED